VVVGDSIVEDVKFHSELLKAEEEVLMPLGI
jgi:hypothetical protein